RFIWRGGSTSNPSLDIRITRQYPEAFAVIRIGGTYEQPDLQLSSDPPQDQMTLLNLLVSGRTGQSPNAPLAVPLQPDAQGAVNRSVSLVMVNALLAVVAPELGLQSVRLEYVENPSSPTNPTGTSERRIAAGVRVSEKIYVGATQISGAAPNHNTKQAEVEYRFAQRWLLQTVLGDIASGLDLFFIYRY